MERVDFEVDNKKKIVIVINSEKIIDIVNIVIKDIHLDRDFKVEDIEKVIKKGIRIFKGTIVAIDLKVIPLEVVNIVLDISLENNVVYEKENDNDFFVAIEIFYSFTKKISP